jgi:hypothetical protein
MFRHSLHPLLLNCSAHSAFGRGPVRAMERNELKSKTTHSKFNGDRIYKKNTVKAPCQLSESPKANLNEIVFKKIIYTIPG